MYMSLRFINAIDGCDCWVRFIAAITRRDYELRFMSAIVGEEPVTSGRLGRRDEQHDGGGEEHH